MDPLKPVNEALNNLKTLWSNIIPKSSSSSSVSNNCNPPFCSLSTYFSWNKKNKALSTAEIMKRMVGIPAYRLSNSDGLSACWKSKHDPERDIEFYYMNKKDAHDDFAIKLANCEIFDIPLHYIVQHEGQRKTPVRLVPESSQVKNAIELRRKDSSDFVDESFVGVPVFQSEFVAMPPYRPAYFRMEDLEKDLIAIAKPEDRDSIKVAAFENIIQEMKDGSTSESKDVLFIGPGITSWMWI